MMADGSVGIYSANPNLFGNIQVGDTKSQQLLEKARKKGAKDTLAFVLPAPFIKTTDGKTDSTHTKFSLKNSILTLTATDLKKLSYPLSIDPSVVVTTTGDFQTGYDDGMIDYGNLTANAITRNNISGGAVGSTTQTNPAFTNARVVHSSVAYNGFLYVIGGNASATVQNDIQFSTINSNGSLSCPTGFTCSTGVFTQQTSAFTTARQAQTSVAYNGYLYIIGGSGSGGSLNDVQHCPLNSNGSVGTCIQQTSAFTTARSAHTSIVYNGFVYIIGGLDGSSNPLGDIQFASINGNGSLSCPTGFTCPTGVFTQQTSAFTTARYGHSSVVYNGYLYIIGGCSAGACTAFQNDIQYCPLNSNGSVGTCTQQTSAFTTARDFQTTVVANGYLYIIGGCSAGNCTTFQNDIQYCPLNSNGSVGTCTQQTSAFTTARAKHTSVFYNGYMYIIGGCSAGNCSTPLNDVQYLQIQPMGTAGPSTQQTNMFTNARYAHASVVFNGFLYIIGGINLTTYYNDIIYCPINSDGSVGTCTQKTNAFTTTRADLSAAVYNGYLYIIGGNNAGTYLNDVQYCPLPSSGVPGACTQQTTAFTTIRYGQTSVVYNGYLYIIGGCGVGNCTSVLNDVQYAWLDPSTGKACLPSNHATCTGTVFAQQTNAFTTPRYWHVSAVYNGFVYIAGGWSGSAYQNDIQFAAINSNGSLSCPSGFTCSTGVFTQQTNAFTTVRGRFASAVYNGYLYLIGGFSGAVELNDVVNCPLAGNGSVGTCTQQNNAFTSGRHGLTSIVSNGYLYTIGGYTGSYQNDIQRLWLGQMGQVGSATQQTSAFTTARDNLSSVAYNGYLYIVGGCSAGSCSTYQNDIQFCPLNSNGSIGTCHFTHAGLDDGASFVAAAFTSARMSHTSVVYNGYLYIMGGQSTASATGCDANSTCNDAQYCPLNSNGTVGACTQQLGAFTTTRYLHSSVVYNGFVYIIGGFSGTGSYQSDIQYAAINSNGSLSCPSGATCTGGTVFSQQTSAFTTARAGQSSVAYNGYLYIIGGSNGTYQNDIQYCPLNSNGSVGTCTQEAGAFTTGREYHTSVVYNGYIYIAGGYNGGLLSDIQYCPLSSTGWVGVCGYTGSAFTTARYGHSSVVYNGYLYLSGGCSTTGSCAGYQNDIQYLPLSSSPLLADYEKTFDTGTGSATIQSIIYNRNASTDDMCGEQLWYATAGSNGQFGSWTVINPAYAGTTYNINAVSKEYVLVKLVMDDQSCGGQSNVTDMTVNYIAPPSTPTTISPSAGVTDITTLTPSFTLRSSDSLNHNLQYKLTICTDAALTLNCKSVDQTSSQTGWSGQDAGGGTAYVGNTTLTSSTIATYTYTGSPALNWGTTYYWQGSACDSTDTSNGCSLTPSSVQSFATSYQPSAPTLSAPGSSQTGVSTTPEFRLYSTDQDNDYLRYEIILYDSNCSSQTQVGTGTYDENSSQTGWSGQSANSATAYTSGQTAIYKLQTALTANATYCWKAAAKDPLGSNTFGSFSGTQTFTTGTAAPNGINIHPQGGNIQIYSGTTIGG